jgi:hypothetical protein
MDGTYSMHRIDEKCIQNFGGKPEGKRPVERSKRSWEVNIKMEFREIGSADLDGIHPA